MKNKFFLSIIVVAFLGALVFGLVYRTSYTNLTEEENYLDHMKVAEIPENICISTCESLQQTLPNAPIILRVTPVNDLEHHFGVSQQKVAIKQVFAGSNLNVGDEIFITSYRWRVIINERINTLERGFINILKDNSDYLVFLSDYSGLISDDVPVYYLYGESYISPVFCYDDIPNVIVTPLGESTYVPYKQVMNNEFFATTEESLKIWHDLKQGMLNTYPAQ